MMKLVYITVICFLFAIPLQEINAQDDMRIMHYNLLFYGNPFACDENNNNTNLKDQNLKILMDFIAPDILTVNEINSEESYHDRLLDQVLNTEGTSSWSRAISTNTNWDSGIVNMLYYNHEKYELYDQEVADESADGIGLIRVVDMYTLYQKNSALQGDTIFFNILVAHLSAGDANMRLLQCQAAMERIENNGPGNYIFSGDFNIDSSNEGSYQELINYDDANFNFFDPLNAPGIWHNNPELAFTHTQSTHLNGGGCFAGGGMDDRFDFTLINSDILNGISGLEYVNDSYRALGNDGDNFDQSLRISNNGDVPTNIAITLYSISDHLPIITDYIFDTAVGIDQLNHTLHAEISLSHNNILNVSFDNNIKSTLQIFDTQGRLIIGKESVDSNVKLNLSALHPSIYILSIRDIESGLSNNKTFYLNRP